MITCPHWSRSQDRGQGKCVLGLYGGAPWVGNCLACMARGENTPEFAAALFARADRTHPADRQRISGCCGSALDG